MNLTKGDMLAIILGWLALMWVVVGAMDQPPTVPACQEDEVVVGVGDFDNGYWSGYECRNFEEVR